MPVVAPVRGRTLRVVPEKLLTSETGSWTPELTTGGSDLTGNFTGTYTRVGNVVTVAMYYDINSIAGISGNVGCTIPFNVSSTGSNFYFLPVVYATMDPTNNDATNRVDHNGVFVRLTAGANTGAMINYRNHNTSGAATSGFQTQEASSTVFSTTTIMYCTGSYMTDGVKLV